MYVHTVPEPTSKYLHQYVCTGVLDLRSTPLRLQPEPWVMTSKAHRPPIRGRAGVRKGQLQPIVGEMLPDVYPSTPESEWQTRVQLSPHMH
jgi:hypothetical protein